MGFKKNLLNKKFGKWKVISVGKQNKYRTTLWICKCKCGKVKELSCTSLLSGRSKQCRKCCIKNYTKILTRYSDREAVYRHLYTQYKGNATKHGTVFDLPFEVFSKLITSSCFYCGIRPYRTRTIRGKSSRFNGIDRLNNQKGYIKSNCVAACKYCNISKNDRSITKFKNWIRQVYRKQYE
jgi:hypothetical protein